jgi:D-alanine-D-alanine ligase
MGNKAKIAVIFGGPSAEHEVSLKSAKGVMSCLDRKKYEILPILISKTGKWDKKLLKASKIDLAIIIGHGTYMEDGQLQSILDSFKIPYLFSGAAASALAMNKYKSKIIAEKNGLEIAKGKLIRKGKRISSKKIIKEIKFPMVIKPNALGSSIGTSIVKNESEFKKGLKVALKCSQEVLLEKFISGRELTNVIVELDKTVALPVIEIKPRVSGWFDYKAKYKKGGSEEICPAKIPPAIAQKTKTYAKKIFQAIGCRDLARADFIWNEKSDKIYFLEINTIPGMTETSLTPLAIKKYGYNFKDFWNILIKKRLSRINSKKK